MTRNLPPKPLGLHLCAATLHRAHAEDVARYLARLGARDVADEVQETFLRAHRAGGFVLGNVDPRTWLYRIATHVRIEGRRRARRRPADLDEEAMDTAIARAPSPEDDAATRERLSWLSRALDTLSDEQRSVFVLCELEGESRESTGQILEIPIGTVDSRLHHAKEKLKDVYRCWQQGKKKP